MNDLLSLWLMDTGRRNAQKYYDHKFEIVEEDEGERLGFHHGKTKRSEPSSSNTDGGKAGIGHSEVDSLLDVE
jgi:hypothetical protein